MHPIISEHLAIELTQPTKPLQQLNGLLAVNIEQLCRMTSLGRSFVYLAINRGELRRIKMGKRTLILISDALDWLRGGPIKSEVTS